MMHIKNAKNFNYICKKLIFFKYPIFFLTILAIIFLVWIAQTLFLSQAAKSGFNGWDDWGMVVTYDAFNGNDLRNFPAIARFYGSPYLWSQSYNIGIIKNIFGLHQTPLRLLELFVKSLAVLAAGYMVFKLTKDKLFASFVVFFSIIFASTAGPLSHIIFIGAYFTIIFMCFSVIFYKRILLSSLFFFLALLACPSRAYLIVPVPFFVELALLLKSRNLLTFLKRIFIFYFPLLVFQILLFLNGDRPHPAFMPHLDMLSRLEQVTSGNLYTLSLPFQAISNLFIDVSFIQEIVQGRGLLFGFTLINLILLTLSLCLSAALKGRKFIPFTFRLMGLTIIFEIIFYALGRLSLLNNQITYISVIKWIKPYSQDFAPSIFQASLGGFYFILGLFIGWEWWRNQRKNSLLKVIFFAWLWSVLSEILLYLTSHWYGMLTQSFDRYIITSSLGAVIFIAGIFVLCIHATSRIQNFKLKLLSFSLIGVFSLLITWKNYQLLNQYYYNVNENYGLSADWQNTMYKRFLNKFGADNLTKSALLYIDFNQQEAGFDQVSFIYPARFRLFYSSNGTLIRNNCKAVTSDINVLKESYVLKNGEEGFLIESICLNSVLSYQMTFYPLSNFYAYRMENKEFFDIREKTLKQMAKPTGTFISSPFSNETTNNLTVKPKGIYPDSFYYPFKRIWEKFLLFILFIPQAKINYEIKLLNERMIELEYTVRNNVLSKIEDASKRFAYQAGILTRDLIKQNNIQDRNDLIEKFEENLKLLAILRDHFHSNTSFWLLIQDDINTLKILSDQLK